MSPRHARVLRDQGEAGSPGAALHRHLIAVTQRLLAAHGSAGLTTREIAREAQVADGLLYNHFASKDDLVATALGERATELVHDFLAARPEPGTATLEENLATLARAVFDFNACMVPLVTGLFGQADLLHAFFSDFHTGQVGPRAAFTAAVEYVSAEQRLGRAADDVDPVAVVEMLLGACLVRALAAQMGQAADSGPQADLDAIVSVLVRALHRPTT